MKGPTSHDRELALIGALCREIAKLGLNVGMSDARPAAVIRTAVVNPPLWITVDLGRQYFEWRDAEYRHAVADVSGAAARIAQHVRDRDRGLGDGS